MNDCLYLHLSVYAEECIAANYIYSYISVTSYYSCKQTVYFEPEGRQLIYFNIELTLLWLLTDKIVSTKEHVANGSKLKIMMDNIIF